MKNKEESQSLADAIVLIASTPNIWAATPIEQTPEVRLARWSVRQIEVDGEVTRHFVGWNETEYEGRVSTAILEFDRATMRGRTASGRVYELVGDPGRDPDGEYVFTNWKRMCGVAGDRDVSDELMEAQ